MKCSITMCWGNSKLNAITKRYYRIPDSGWSASRDDGEILWWFEAEIDDKAKKLYEQLKSVPSAYAYPVTADKKRSMTLWPSGKMDLDSSWANREFENHCLSLKMQLYPGASCPLHIRELEALCLEYGSEIVLYAHASVGVLHVRPYHWPPQCNKILITWKIFQIDVLNWWSKVRRV